MIRFISKRLITVAIIIASSVIIYLLFSLIDFIISIFTKPPILNFLGNNYIWMSYVCFIIFVIIGLYNGKQQKQPYIHANYLYAYNMYFHKVFLKRKMKKYYENGPLHYTDFKKSCIFEIATLSAPLLLIPLLLPLICFITIELSAEDKAIILIICSISTRTGGSLLMCELNELFYIKQYKCPNCGYISLNRIILEGTLEQNEKSDIIRGNINKKRGKICTVHTGFFGKKVYGYVYEQEPDKERTIYNEKYEYTIQCEMCDYVDDEVKYYEYSNESYKTL